MLTFKDLSIKLNDISIEIFIDEITQKLDNQALWARQEDKENNVLGIEKIYSFKRKKDNKLPSVGLSLFPKNEDIWYVPNVVPLEFGQLSHQEYNDILTEFYDLIIAPISKRIKIIPEITSGNKTDIDILGQQGAELLKLFSLCANKSTGSSHPSDQEKWFAFLDEACQATNNIDTGYLVRILQEQGWDEEHAEKLAIEFEFARDLIEYLRK